MGLPPLLHTSPFIPERLGARRGGVPPTCCCPKAWDNRRIFGEWAQPDVRVKPGTNDSSGCPRPQTFTSKACPQAGRKSFRVPTATSLLLLLGGGTTEASVWEGGREEASPLEASGHCLYKTQSVPQAGIPTSQQLEAEPRQCVQGVEVGGEGRVQFPNLGVQAGAAGKDREQGTLEGRAGPQPHRSSPQGRPSHIAESSRLELNSQVPGSLGGQL